MISERLLLWMGHRLTPPPAKGHFRMHLVDSFLHRVIGSQEFIDFSNFRQDSPGLSADLSAIGLVMLVLRLLVRPGIQTGTNRNRKDAAPSGLKQLASLLAARPVARRWQTYRNIDGENGLGRQLIQPFAHIGCDHHIEFALDLVDEYPTALASVGACNWSVGSRRHFSNYAIVPWRSPRSDRLRCHYSGDRALTHALPSPPRSHSKQRAAEPSGDRDSRAGGALELRVRTGLPCSFSGYHVVLAVKALRCSVGSLLLFDPNVLRPSLRYSTESRRGRREP